MMYTFATGWNANNNEAYVIGGAPNSNTYAHFVATAGQFFTVGSPPSAIGW